MILNLREDISTRRQHCKYAKPYAHSLILSDVHGTVPNYSQRISGVRDHYFRTKSPFRAFRQRRFPHETCNCGHGNSNNLQLVKQHLLFIVHSMPLAHGVSRSSQSFVRRTTRAYGVYGGRAGRRSTSARAPRCLSGGEQRASAPAGWLGCKWRTQRRDVAVACSDVLALCFRLARHTARGDRSGRPQNAGEYSGSKWAPQPIAPPQVCTGCEWKSASMSNTGTILDAPILAQC